MVHIADGTPTLGGTIGDKAEVTNHECQQWWHELGSVVQGETVRTRRESTQPLGGEGGRGREGGLARRAEIELPERGGPPPYMVRQGEC